MLHFRKETTGELLLNVLQGSFQKARADQKSVIAGLITSLGGSAILLIIFCLIRPRNSLIYAPKIKYISGDKRPPLLGSGPLSLIRNISKISDLELAHKIGLDATLFIQFIRMCRDIALFLTILLCGLGIPINVHYNLQSDTAKDLKRLHDSFILLTPSMVSGMPLIAHIIMTYLVDIIVMIILWINLSKAINLRRHVYASKEYQRHLFTRSLTVLEIPQKCQSDAGLAQLITNTINSIKGPHSYEIEQARIGRDSKRLTHLMEQHTETVHKLESVLAKYLKDPENLPHPPRCRPFKEDRDKYPSKVDAIDYYGQRMKHLERQILTERDGIEDRVSMSYGFVSFSNQEQCHRAARDLGTARLRRKGKALVQLASRPSDIIWSNIVIQRLERGTKQFWGNVFFVTLLILWIVPNVFIGCFLTDLSRVGELWPAWKEFFSKRTVFFSIVQGTAAPLVTLIIFTVLPVILRRMSNFQGRITRTARERDVLNKLFIFFFFNNFFVVTIIGVAWNVGYQIAAFIDGSQQATSVADAWNQLRLGQQICPAIINASSFWVMYVLQAYLAGVIELLQIVSLSWKSFQRRFMSPTPRQLIQWTAPEGYTFASHCNLILFYIGIGLCFTSIQPLIMPVVCFYMTCNVFFKKYSLMYVFITKNESDGAYWPMLHRRIIFSTGFGNLMMFALIWIKGGWKMAVAVAPLFVLLAVFWIVTSRKIMKRFFYFIPDENERKLLDEQDDYEQDKDQRSSLLLASRYENPAITKNLSVPMVHARAQHLLPKICSFLEEGIQDDDEYVVAYEFNKGSRVATETFQDKSALYRARSRRIGTTVFDIVPENELTFDKAPQIIRDEAVSIAGSDIGRKTDFNESDDAFLHENDLVLSHYTTEDNIVEVPLHAVQTSYSGYADLLNPYTPPVNGESSYSIDRTPSPLHGGTLSRGVLGSTLGNEMSMTERTEEDEQRLLEKGQ